MTGVCVDVGVCVGVLVLTGVSVGVCVAVGEFVGVFVGVLVGATTKNSIGSLHSPARELSPSFTATTLKMYSLPGVNSKFELSGEDVATPPA